MAPEATTYPRGVKPLYGRIEAIARARLAAERARAGEGTLLLLTGEPGIGKSRLAEHIADLAASMGAVVAWGRCWEAGGAPAYWPWIQVFRELKMDPDPFAVAGADLGSGESEARFAAFDLAVRRLVERAARQPLLLVLDDLHAADVPSLLLLLLLARALRRTRLLVVGAYREAEARQAPELAGLIGKLAREGEVLALAGLAPSEVKQWLREAAPGSEGQAPALHRMTEGHPLFVAELLRLGHGWTGSAPLTEGLRAVLDERLALLPTASRALLEAASVLGRELTPSELAETAALPLAQVGEGLQAAAATGLLLPVDGGERLRFSHLLLRDRLYTRIGPSARAALHWRAGSAQLARGVDPVQAVHHLFEGQSAGSAERVAEVALAAAERAIGRLAFEDAARVARRGLDLAGQAGLAPRLRCGLQLALAEALVRLGETAPGKETAVQAARLSRELGAPDLLARAALVYSAEVVTGTRDDRGNALLREALAATSEGDSPTRARLLARLAAGVSPARDRADVEEILGLMQAAQAMARRLGDAYTLLYVLHFVAAAGGYLVPDEERFALLQETVRLAVALDQRLLLLTTYGNYIAALLGQGQRAEAAAALEGYEQLVAEVAQPHQAWRLPLVRATFHAFGGDYPAAEAQSAEAHALAQEAGSRSGLALWAIQRLSLAKLRGEPTLIAADAEEVLSLIRNHPIQQHNTIWILAATGRREEAARALAALPVDPDHHARLLGTSEACVLLGDATLAARLYELLSALPNRMFWFGGGGGMIGPVARVLGDLARLLGRREAALRHYDDASALGEKMGAVPILESCRRARALVLAESPAAVAPAVVPPAPAPAPPGLRLELRREGDVWAIATAGGTLRLKHAKGLVYLDYLLEQPGRQVHVLELAGIEHQTGDAGPILDARAKAAYRSRLDDLREELQEGERFGDAGRVSRAQAEIEAIAEQLAGAVGLGGRDRRAASDAERARINVQRRLKDAIDRIAAADAALGRYLAASVKTGTYCAFEPV